MADWYIDSGASGANDGTSKTDAWADISTAAAAASSIAVGDRVFLSHTHAASYGANTTYAFTAPYIANGGISFYSVDFGGSTPPVKADYLRGAKETVTGYLLANATSDFVNCSWYGIDFHVSATFWAGWGDAGHYYYDCIVKATAGTYLWKVNTSSAVTFEQCEFEATGAGQYIQLIASTTVKIIDCALTGTALTSTVFYWTQIPGLFEVRGLDCSNCGAGIDIIGATPTIGYGQQHIKMSGLKMPTSWTGTLMWTAALSPQDRYEAWITDDADTSDQFLISSGAGDVIPDSSKYHTGTWSHKMTGTSVTPRTVGAVPLWCEVAEVNVETGTTKLTTRFTSATALNDANFWIQIQGPDSTTYPLQKFNYSRGYDDLLDTSPTAHTSDSGWTSGATNEYKYDYTISGMAVPGVYRVFAYLASATNAHVVYVDSIVEQS